MVGITAIGDKISQYRLFQPGLTVIQQGFGNLRRLDQFADPSLARAAMNSLQVSLGAALLTCALALALSSIGGPVTLAAAIVLNALFIRGAYRILRRDEAVAEADRYKAERGFFKLSLAYLFLHFGALLVEASLKPFGLGGW